MSSIPSTHTKADHPARQYFHQGTSLASQGNRTQAIQAFRNALKADPPTRALKARIRYSLGMQYAETGQSERAIKVFERALRATPSDKELEACLNYHLGMCHYDLRKTEQAIQAFNQSLRTQREHRTITPDKNQRAEAFNWLGCALLDEGEIEAANTFLKAALRQGTDDQDLQAQILSNLGLIALSTSRDPIPYFANALLARPNDPELITDILYNQGMAYKKQGDYQSAQRFLEAALNEKGSSSGKKKRIRTALEKIQPRAVSECDSSSSQGRLRTRSSPI